MKRTKFKETEIGKIPEEWEVEKFRDNLKVKGSFISANILRPIEMNIMIG